MVVRAGDQLSIVDVTDAYGVTLTSEAHTFPGSTSAALAGSVTTQVLAMRGSERVAASVTLSEVVAPSGVSVTKDTDTTSPTLTIAVSAGVAAGGVVKIPVHIGDVVINKEFSFAIAFKGNTGSTGGTGAPGVGVAEATVTYQAASSGTAVPSGTWVTSIPQVPAGQYLWTRTVTTYTNNSSSAAYSVALMGSTGATGATGAPGVGVKLTSITYQAGVSGTSAPTGSWEISIPSVSANQYLWTRTVTTYTDNSSATAYSIGLMGAQGPKGDTGSPGVAGADAITLTITSSNGTIFKNSAIETVLTAHVYRAGIELSAAQVGALGSVKWYKGGSSSAVSIGLTLTINAGSVTGKASYSAQLEG
ncbi:hypothetical protein [Gordonibacter sp.]|uniref:hypothetical protein n=1 Tax=Gordonibacter sp. TaxID=1968902 RepID=UPI002FCA53A9